MPLTSFQAAVARLLSTNRSPDSYLAGGSAIHLEPNTTRYSNDLDYFQDSEKRVLQAFNDDRELLQENGYQLLVDLQLPTYVRAVASLGNQATKIEWAHDSAWRFMPTVEHPEFGFLLHPIDLAINKVLTLAGRNEPRDFIDTLHVHATTLPLGAMCWAAPGKDPGFSPLSLLELLRRRGRYRPEQFDGLLLSAPLDLPTLKQSWLAALDAADRFIRSRPPEEVGCLYYAPKQDRFLEPPAARQSDLLLHFGRPGGVLPRITS